MQKASGAGPNCRYANVPTRRQAALQHCRIADMQFQSQNGRCEMLFTFHHCSCQTVMQPRFRSHPTQALDMMTTGIRKRDMNETRGCTGGKYIDSTLQCSAVHKCTHMYAHVHTSTHKYRALLTRSTSFPLQRLQGFRLHLVSLRGWIVSIRSG